MNCETEKCPFTVSEDQSISTDNRDGKKYKAVSTGGDYGCIGCHFFDSDDGVPCLGLPCGSDEWKDGESRIWEEVTE